MHAIMINFKVLMFHLLLFLENFVPVPTCNPEGVLGCYPCDTSLSENFHSVKIIKMGTHTFDL